MVINCEFSAEALEDKLLNRLDKTQESVQELSRWLIKNHKNGDVVVKTWVWLSNNSLFAQGRHQRIQKLREVQTQTILFLKSMSERVGILKRP